MITFSQISLEKNIKNILRRESFKKKVLEKRINKKRDKRGINCEK